MNTKMDILKALFRIETPNQSFRFNAGDTVTSTGKGCFKTGIPVVIAERWIENGYAYYQDTNGVCHRDKDIQ